MAEYKKYPRLLRTTTKAFAKFCREKKGNEQKAYEYMLGRLFFTTQTEAEEFLSSPMFEAKDAKTY